MCELVFCCPFVLLLCSHLYGIAIFLCPESKHFSLHCSNLKVWWRRFVARRIMDDNGGPRVFTRWELDYTLSSNDKLDLLDEYLEMGKTLTVPIWCLDTNEGGI